MHGKRAGHEAALSRLCLFSKSSIAVEGGGPQPALKLASAGYSAPGRIVVACASLLRAAGPATGGRPINISAGGKPGTGVGSEGTLSKGWEWRVRSAASRAGLPISVTALLSGAEPQSVWGLRSRLPRFRHGPERLRGPQAGAGLRAGHHAGRQGSARKAQLSVGLWHQKLRAR